MTKDTKNFSFSEENKLLAVEILKKYPVKRKNSAVMPLLDIAQRQNDGWLSRVAIEYVAEYLSMPIIKVLEVVTFYTMYHTKPVGKYLVQVCTTSPCWLRGSDNVVKACKEMRDLEDELLPIMSTLKESLPMEKQSWDSNRKYTTMSSSYNHSRDMKKAFSQLHQETMKNKNMGTIMNKQIAHIEKKQQEALDFLFGLNEIQGLKEGLNKILNKADIKLLGE